MTVKFRVDIGVKDRNLRAISMLDSILVMRLNEFPPRVSITGKRRQLKTEAWGTPKLRGWREVRDPIRDNENAGGRADNVFSESQVKKVFVFQRGRDQKC